MTHYLCNDAQGIKLNSYATMNYYIHLKEMQCFYMIELYNITFTNCIHRKINIVVCFETHLVFHNLLKCF